jgi:hypothetical protein
LRDSHTPQTLKAQLGLVLVLFVVLLLVPLRWAIWWAAVLITLLFLLSALPFTVRALRKDLLIGLLSPCFLFLRAVALGLGMIKGSWDAAFRKEAMH